MKEMDAVDVIVVGTGAAGLTAAVVAHDRGAKVAVLECTDKVGGTSAVSGGGVWVPMNHHMGALGIQDSRAEALAYCKALAMGRADDKLVETFVDTAAQMVRYLEDRTPLRFSPVSAPDYQTEMEGAKPGGRALEAVPFETERLGEWRNHLRPPSSLAFPVTLQEVYQEYQAFYQPWRIPQDLIVDRMMRGVVCLGQALVAPLLKAVADRGISLTLRCRGRRLLRDGDRIAGVIATHEGSEVIFPARRGVILASGGFEWNEELKRRFLPAPITHPNSPPFSQGDGLLMAMDVGADLANMGEAWHYPSLAIPGESYEGKPLSRGIKAERAGPHVIWVNRKGQRFVDEAANYNSVGKVFATPDTDAPGYRNLPAWAILDSQYRERYAIGTTMPGDPLPQWIVQADTLDQLAARIGVDPSGLTETVARWNTFCRDGVDRDFARGASRFDRYQGDHLAPHPNLGTIEKGPFYAFQVVTGALGTKGGPRTNEYAQVMNVRDEPITGLYAAGNVAASVAGGGYYGPGSTLGPAMTFAYIAANHISLAASR